MTTYYYDGNGPYSWNQLLFVFCEELGRVKYSWSRARGRSYEIVPSPPSPTAFQGFFSNFRHNGNDGNWVGGHYNWNFYDHQFWVPGRFVHKQHCVVDSFGRTINSADLRQALLAYQPNLADHIDSKRRHKTPEPGYRFRQGPVPGIRGYRNHNHAWHQYRGEHGHTIQELRQWHRDALVKKELQLELGLSIKLGRNSHDLNPYNHGHHVGCHGYGWKRSKKQKQWMKHGWKKCYPAPASDADLLDADADGVQ